MTENSNNKYIDLRFQNVQVEYNLNGEIATVEGFLFNFVEDKAVVLTSNKKEIIDLCCIISINKIHTWIEESMPLSDDDSSYLSGFEKALLACEKEVVEEYIANPEKLSIEGYDEKEIKMITSQAVTTVPWNDDEKNTLYNKARRVYQYILNKHRLAEKLFLQFLDSEQSNDKKKQKSKALKSLMDIYSHDLESLNKLFNRFYEYIIKTPELKNKLASIYIKQDKYDKAKVVVGDLRSNDADNSIVFALNFYEKCKDYDFAYLPGLNILDPYVGYDELTYLSQLPDTYSLIKLLGLYCKASRYESFFALIDLCMPCAVNDPYIVSWVGECLSQCSDFKYINEYLPQFVLLWFDRDLTNKYLSGYMDNLTTINNSRTKNLLGQCKRAQKYAIPNELENVVINGNFQLWDVYLSNDSLLISFGYNADEINSIKKLDVDSIKYGNKTAIERLLLIEGNRNYIPESQAGKDFLNSPLNVCKALFPILINDGSGELVYELYNYTQSITNKLLPLKGDYYKALVLLDKDEELWEEIKDNWYDMQLDPAILETGKQLALSRGDNITADAMNMYSEIMPFNDFETALINGDVTKLRSIVTDAEYMLNAGYSSEDIVRIQECSRLKTDFTSKEPLDIANRLYTFQKNKNHSAEFYYKIALEKHDLQAALGLVAIYYAENKYSELCNIYENYLVENNQVIQNEMMYFEALFNLGRFHDCYLLWNLKKESLSTSDYYILKTLINDFRPDEEVDDILCNLQARYSDSSKAKEVVGLLLKEKTSPNRMKYIIRVFNNSIKLFNSIDIEDIKEAIAGQDLSIICRPEGSGLLALLDEKNKYELLYEWSQMLFDSDPENVVQLAEKITELFDSQDVESRDFLRRMVTEIRTRKVALSPVLSAYQMPMLDTDEDKQKWINSIIDNPWNVDEASFDMFWGIVVGFGDYSYAQKLLSLMPRGEYNDKCNRACITVIEEYLKADAPVDDIECMLECICKFSREEYLDLEDIGVLNIAYCKIGNKTYADISSYIIATNNQNNALELDDSISVFSCLQQELRREYISETNRFIQMWSKYIKLSEVDNRNVDFIKDYYNMPEKWQMDHLESLAKYLMRFPKVLTYWKLMDEYYSEHESIIKSNIKCHIAIYNSAKLVPALKFASDYGLKNHALYVLYAILKNIYPKYYWPTKQAIDEVVNKHRDWIADENAAKNLLPIILDNRDRQFNSEMWLSLVELGSKIAIAAGLEESFFNSFNLLYERNMSIIAGKILASILLKNDSNTELIQKSVEAIREGYLRPPYEDVLFAIAAAPEGERNSDSNRAILRLIIDNNGEKFDENTFYRFYISSILAGNNQLVFEVCENLEKYYPDNSVIKDIKKYVLLTRDLSDDDVLSIYNSEFADLKQITDIKRLNKSVSNLMAGEIYLKRKMFEVESAYEFGVANASVGGLEVIQNRRALFKSLEKVFSDDIYPGLYDVFIKCLFLRKWDEFIQFRIDDKFLNDIIRNDPVVKELVSTRSYDILKSSVNCLINAEDCASSVIERSEALYEAVGTLNVENKYLSKIISYSREQLDVLRKIFSLRIESVTLRAKGIIGCTVLSIEGNEEVSEILGILTPIGLYNIFDHYECANYLNSMPVEKAMAICKSYVRFLSSINRNIFATYIAKHTPTKIETGPVESPEMSIDNCEIARNRYLAINSQFINSHSNKKLISQYLYDRMSYIYLAVTNKSVKDIRIINPTKRDYLSVMTWIFNFKNSSDLNNYIYKLKSGFYKPVFAWLLVLLEQYQVAYTLISSFDTDEWKEAVLVHLYRCLSHRCYTEDDNLLKTKIKSEVPYDTNLYVNKFLPRNKNEIDNYANKMRELRMVTEEYKEFISKEYPECSSFLVDEERFRQCLSFYGIELPEKSQTVLPLVNKQGYQSSTNIQNNANKNVEYKSDSNMTVAKLVSNDLLSELINEIERLEDTATDISNKDIYHYVNQLKMLVDEKGESSYYGDLASARNLIRWIYILMISNTSFNREYFNQVLYYIAKNEKVSKKQWESILSLIYAYFDHIESLEQLSRTIEVDVVYLNRVFNVSHDQLKLLRGVDKTTWASIISVLVDIGSIDFSRTVEREQIKILNSCKQVLLSINGNSKASVFDRVSNTLLRLVVQRTTQLRHTPELSIEIIGENSNKSQTVFWERDNKSGTLYAVISNVGGSDCHQVTVTSYVNMTKIKKSSIKTIYSGERIPFNQPFDSGDLVDGKTSWYIEISYFDSSKNETVYIKRETSVSVRFGDDSLRLGNIRYGNPAIGAEFVGRTREMALLRNNYADSSYVPSMLIRGLKRSGKSSILIQLSEELKKDGKVIVSLVDGQSIGNALRAAFVDKVIDNIRIGYRNNKDLDNIINDQLIKFSDSWKSRLDSSNWIGYLDVFYYELSQLFGKKILVMIDEMEAIFYNNRFESIDQEETLYAALRSLIQKPDNYVSFIFCGSDKLLTSCLEKRRESQMFQTLQYLEVGHMTIGDIQKIFRIQSSKYDIKYSEDAVDAIWQFTSGMVWYAKLIGYLIINNILALDLSIRKDVNRSDVMTAVQMLINGEIGTDKFDLVDASLDTKRVAIIHAMARIMPDRNKEVSIDEVLDALRILKDEGFVNSRTGESVPEMDEKELYDNLLFLEKMQFVDSNESNTKFAFTSELYRLFFRKDKRLHMFEERGA